MNEMLQIANGLCFCHWNANWPMECETKMAVHGGEFCTSVLVPYTVCRSVLVAHTIFYTFRKSSILKYVQKISSNGKNGFRNFKYNSTK